MQGEKKLIISPQAGFGNRLRAMNSALIIARKTQRNLYHCWLPSPPNHHIDFVNRLKVLSYEDFFELNLSMPPVSGKELVDECVSQCGIHDYWFETHSSGQKLFNTFARQGTRDSFSAIKASTSRTVLLETTLRVWPRDFDGITEIMPSHENATLIKQAYESFRPRQGYLDLLDQLDNVDIAFWIRHGDLSKYYKRAEADIQYVHLLLKNLKERGLRIAVFSNDSYLQNTLIHDSGIKPLREYYSSEIINLPQHKLAALQFFFMALKTKLLVGTPGSSFAQEASLYGKSKYLPLSRENDILHQLLTDS